MSVHGAALSGVLVLAACGAVASKPDAGDGGPKTLTVIKDGTGTGTVASAPAGIFCGATCAATFDAGTTVTLTATATGPSSSFVGWSGACTGAGTCTVTIDQDAEVTATFVSTAFALTVNVAGIGMGAVTSTPGTINCPGTCSGDFAADSSVNLVASAASGSVFTGWSGACTGTQATCAVTMNAAKSVTATFQPSLCPTGNFDRFNAPDSSTITGWTERLGDWQIATNRVRHANTGGAYTHHMTRDNSSQTDGCASLTAVATPVSGNTIQAAGVVLRWTAADSYVVGLVQDNINAGVFNTLYIYQYPGTTQLATLGNQALGATPRVQLCVTGNQVTLRADAANDGTFESMVTGTTSLAGAGVAGVMTHTFSSQALVDDFCVGQ